MNLPHPSVPNIPTIKALDTVVSGVVITQAVSCPLPCLVGTCLSLARPPVVCAWNIPFNPGIHLHLVLLIGLRLLDTHHFLGIQHVSLPRPPESLGSPEAPLHQPTMAIIQEVALAAPLPEITPWKGDLGRLQKMLEMEIYLPLQDSPVHAFQQVQRYMIQEYLEILTAFLLLCPPNHIMQGCMILLREGREEEELMRSG